MLILWGAYEEAIKEEDGLMEGGAIRKSSLTLKPTVRIGKKGVTEALIKEISKHLDTRRRVKIKILRSALLESTVEDIARRISSETGSRIIQIIGHTFTLYKPKRRSGATRSRGLTQAEHE